MALALALALCVGEAGCSPPAPRERVVLALADRVHAALAHLALAQGDFEAEGLDMEVRTFSHGRLALREVLEGRADVATSAATPIVIAALHGRPPYVLATISSTNHGSAIVARRGRGLASVKDLAGRRVGVTRGTSSDFALDAALLRAGVSPAAVTRVGLDPAGMEGALRSGAVDALATLEPHAEVIGRAVGDLAVLPDTGSFDAYVVSATHHFAEGRRGAAERVLKALLRAEERARRDPVAAAAAVAARLGMEPALLRATWRELELRVELGQSLIVLLDQQARWAMGSGLAPAQPVPDLRRIVAPEPLRRAKPIAVRLMW